MKFFIRSVGLEAALVSGVLYHKTQNFTGLMTGGRVRHLIRRTGRFLRERWALPTRDPQQQAAALAAWYATPLGEHLLASESALTENLLGSGYRQFLVQLDSGAQRFVGLDQCLRSQASVLLTRAETRAGCPAIRADAEQLPFQPESVDVLLMHHVLEYSPSPHRALREAAQTLRPGGHLLLFSFNPVGLWGWRRLTVPWRRRHAAWEGQFIRAGRVVDWCRLLDCEVEKKRYYYHWPAMHKPGWKRRARWINHLIRVVWPGIGAGYVLLLRKQQMIPLQPARWDPSVLLGRSGKGAHLRLKENGRTGRQTRAQSENDSINRKNTHE